MWLSHGKSGSPMFKGTKNKQQIRANLLDPSSESPEACSQLLLCELPSWPPFAKPSLSLGDQCLGDGYEPCNYIANASQCAQNLAQAGLCVKIGVPKEKVASFSVSLLPTLLPSPTGCFRVLECLPPFSGTMSTSQKSAPAPPPPKKKKKEKEQSKYFFPSVSLWGTETRKGTRNPPKMRRPCLHE